MTNLDTISEARRQLLERFRRGELQAPSVALGPLVPRPPAAQALLSPDLEQLWLHDRLAGGAPINNESFTIHKRGPLDPAALERCFNEIARRHEIWRSAFPMSDGTIVQRIDSNVRIPLPLSDLSHLPVEQREAEAVRIATEDARQPFDLEVAPLFRVRLVLWAEDYHRIYLTAHRLVFDCASIDHVLMGDLAALYSAYSSGQPSPLPELAFQYSDYAAWKQRQSSSGSHAAQMEYWRGTLSGDLQPLELPSNRPHPAEPTWRSGMESFSMPAQLIDALKNFGTAEGVTLYMTLLAAFQVLLHRYSGQDEIILGGKTNTRTRPEFDPLLGSFVNTIVLRSHIDAELSFRQFLGRVKGTVLGALAHSEIPFDDIVRDLAPKRDSKRHPLFQVLFSMRAPYPDLPDGWDITDMEVHSGASCFDLFVEFLEHPRGLAGRFVYSTDLFDRATIRRMLEDFEGLLQELASNPDQAVSRVDRVTAHPSNIALRDIEASLLQHRQVRTAAVLLREHPNFGPSLVAYVAPNESELDAPALRAFLRERLPEHMIPSAFVALESLPKTAGGELDEKALPSPEFVTDPRREFVPPSDDIEERLANVWQELLGVYPVGVTDNYFDLGGHSLLALRLFSEIKFCFQLDLPLATLFQAPTVRTLAGVIRDSGVQAAVPVVPIQPNGTKPAIFCIGALNGEVILYRRLALELGEDQPLYGLQPFSLVDRLSTVQKLAASYIEQLELRGERQPFCLLGYSFGGMVAIEMARQLRKNGVAPPIVALIDAPYLNGCKDLEPWKDRIGRYRYHLNQLVHGTRGLGYLVDRLLSRSFRVVHKVSTTLGVEAPGIASGISGRQLLAAESYRAKPFPGRVCLFKAETRPEFFDADPALGWRKILSDLRIEEIPGDHGTINTGMNLKILARKLTAFLEDSSRSQSSVQSVHAPRLTGVHSTSPQP
jgi:thioesterase domain-containing protein